MAQHHFVVIFDDERNTWKVDHEVTGYAFPDGATYDFDAGWFVAPYSGNTSPEITASFERASGHLASMLALGQFSRDSVS